MLILLGGLWSSIPLVFGALMSNGLGDVLPGVITAVPYSPREGSMSGVDLSWLVEVRAALLSLVETWSGDVVMTPQFVSALSFGSVCLGVLISCWPPHNDDQLATNEDRYWKLVDSSPEMIFVIQANRIVFMNQTGLQLVGATDSQQVLGRSPFDFMHADCRALIQQRLVLLDRSTTIRLPDQKLVRLDGTAMDMDLVAVGGQDGGQPVIQIFCRSRATHQPASDDNGEPSYRALKTEAVGRIAAEIAHDFNNLLTIITTYIEALESSPKLGSTEHELCYDVRKATEDLGTLARRLLNFGRDEPVAPQVVNLNKLVADIQRLLKQAVGVRVQLVTTLSAQRGMIKADRTQLEQVLMNLALNARDAMPNGGTLTIETTNVALKAEDVSQIPGSKPGTFVSLIVRDTGCGMDEKVKPLIFEPYFTTKKTDRNSGLGLASVYTIVRSNGGFIRVDSQSGAGTIFTLHFPTLSQIN